MRRGVTRDVSNAGTRFRSRLNAHPPDQDNFCHMNRFAKLVFAAAIAVTLAFALSPHPPVLIDYDKAQHGLAFSVLAILARLAYPRAPWPLVGLALAGFGGAIELVQSIPALGRTCDVYDWYADIAATALGLLLFSIGKLVIASGRNDRNSDNARAPLDR